MRWLSFCALLLLFAPLGDVCAQERRDSTRGTAATSAASAEELHRIRRMWLEQRRLGRLDDAPPVFGSAIVGAPRPGRATGIVTGGAIGGYGVADGRYGSSWGYAHDGRGCGAFGGYGGYGSHGGYGWYPPRGGRGGWYGRGSFDCVGFLFPGSSFLLPGAFAFGLDGRDGLPYPAYPPVGRFYGRFHEDALRGSAWNDPLLFGVREYELGWWGPWRSFPGSFGWADGAYGWYSAPPWSRSPADCVDLTLALGDGRAHRLQLGLQSLGLADARDLDLAIDARLSEGRPVLLQGLDGRLLRIDPGTQIDDIIVRPCGG